MTARPLQWQIGEVRVTRIVESVTASIGRFVLPEATPEEVSKIAWLGPEQTDPDGRLVMNIQAFLVETPTTRLLVDTCVGNDKPRNFPEWNHLQGPFLERLAATGTPAEQIDHVVCTHLHIDHVGWNTRLIDGKWVPTFPNARYLFGRIEWQHWQDATDEQATINDDSIRPILDAGLADLVETDHRIGPEIHLEPTPGHTPGHVAVRIRSQGEEAVITGDLMHHPCQMAHPEWSARPDHDQILSRATRQSFLSACANRPVLVLGSHFTGATAGHVLRDGNAYRLVDAPAS